MIAQLSTVCFQGIQGIPITVQVQVAGASLPGFSIVGLPDKAVSESKERIRAAFHALGIAFPAKRIIVNLSPANLQKIGSHYDLPMAIGLLMTLELLPKELEDSLAMGELGLDGSIRPVQGVLSAAITALSLEKTFICPRECAGEAYWAGDVPILASSHLLELIQHFKGVYTLPCPQGEMEQLQHNHTVDFSQVHGQEVAKRVLTLAAAGGHNVLMSGPPGTGKSLLASCLMSLSNPLDPEEALEVTMIHSLSGTLPVGKLMRHRPFRNPHHSVSVAALVGGGVRGLPGEISLAHRGILFLDELTEFSHHTLQSLRQALESGEAVVARANHHVTYPARFQLIGAMNPCKCGYLGYEDRQCNRAPDCGKRYQSVLSGPFLDRIDLFVEVPEVRFQDTMSNSESSESLRLKVERARRFSKNRSPCNTATEMDQTLQETPSGKELLLKAADKFRLSPRGYYRTIRLARTIGDMEGKATLCREHIAEALSYRCKTFY